MQDIMQQVINNFVKRKGVSIMLTKTVIRGALSVYYYNWVGTNEKYYSLLVPCNESQIFTVDGDVALIDDMEKALDKNLKQFYTKGEWDVGKWKREVAEEFNSTLEKKLNSIYRPTEPINGYRVVDLKIYLEPNVGISIWYQRETLQNLTVWLGHHRDVFTYDAGLKEFVDQFEFGDAVTVHVLTAARHKLEEKLNYDYDTAF